MFNYFRYPHTDLNQANFGWIIHAIKELQKKVQDIINGGSGERATDIPQLASIPAHSNITQRQIAVLDQEGNIVGDAVNINDVMLKPRRCASGAVGVFDDHGNLLPTSLDERTPLITLADLLISHAMDITASGNRELFLETMNGIHFETGYITASLDTFSTAGNLYRKNINLSVTFETEFDRAPCVLVGGCTDLNNPVIVGGIRVTATGIDRGSFFSYQDYPAGSPLTIKIPYLAIGTTEVHTK